MAKISAEDRRWMARNDVSTLVSAEEIKAFGEKQKINYPLVAVSDEELPEPYNKITSIPTTFFIDSNGVIESVLSGYHSFEELKKHSSGDMQIPQGAVIDTNST